MIMAIGLTVSKISSGQRSEGYCHNEIDCNSVKMQFRTMHWAVGIGLRCLSASSVLSQIVWDPVKNRYVNKDEEDEDAASDTKHDAPPPTDAEFRQKMLPAMSSSAAPQAQNRGMFNRAKTRGNHTFPVTAYCRMWIKMLLLLWLI